MPLPWAPAEGLQEDAAITLAVRHDRSETARSQPFPRPVYEVPTILLLVALACVLARNFLPFVAMAEIWIHDLRVARLTPPAAQNREIAVVTITEETLTAFPYRSPLDRNFLAQVLHSLEAKGARAIGIDILFDQATEPAKDAELQRTLRTLSIPVVVGRVDDGVGLSEGQTDYMNAYLSGVDTALAMLPKDSLDGKVRAILLQSRDHGRSVPGFAAALARATGVQVPRGNYLPLAYHGNPNGVTPPFPTYPAQAIALMPDAWFAGKIVLIGADLTLQDNHLTPFDVGFTRGAGMPGVLIHAHGLAQLMDGRRSRRLTGWQEGFVILLFAAVGVILAFADLGPGVKAAAAPLVLAIAWIGGFALVEQGGPNIPLVVPSLALAGALGGGIAAQWRKERVHRQFIRDAFSKFLAPAIIKHLEADPSRLRLTGENRMMTFLFTDIADFTALMEREDPAKVVPILNDYLDAACNIVLDYSGTIDKIVGDALVVFFNAPLDQPDHADRAVACALALSAFSQEHRARHAAQGTTFGRTRIGVNTGPALVGNFGGNLRFDYTAHGDAINTASRLESANKALGTGICIGDTTVAGCTKFQFRPVAELLLKGKTETIEVFEPVTAAEAADPKMTAYLDTYGHMRREGDGAAAAFAELAARYPDDPLIALHARRLTASAQERRQNLKVSGCTIIMAEK